MKIEWVMVDDKSYEVCAKLVWCEVCVEHVKEEPPSEPKEEVYVLKRWRPGVVSLISLILELNNFLIFNYVIRWKIKKVGKKVGGVVTLRCSMCYQEV